MKTLNLDARDIENILGEVQKILKNEEYVLENTGHTRTSSEFKHLSHRVKIVQKIYDMLEGKLRID